MRSRFHASGYTGRVSTPVEVVRGSRVFGGGAMLVQVELRVLGCGWLMDFVSMVVSRLLCRWFSCGMWLRMLNGLQVW